MLGLALVMVIAAGAAIIGGGSSPGHDSAASTPSARPLVALQVGHWRHEDLPGELRRVRSSAGGATSAGHVEWRVNLAVARAASRLLRERGIVVDLVPATVPPGYRAAAFVSIHADGNADPSVAGFKSAPAAQDATGFAGALNASLARRYGERTGLSWNTSITSDMTNYYAFDGARFRHAISSSTPAVVLEAGFLTNARDRRVIAGMPERAAQGISAGIVEFLRQRGLAR